MSLFTPTEWEIIEHRLGAPDAIAEVLEEEQGYDPEYIEARVYELQKKGQAALKMDDTYDQAILIDCCEGCTLFSDMETAVHMGELTRGKALAYFKAAKSLEALLPVDIPRS